ncbi:MAG TPA: PH domain-containing protein [Ignavibacteria bacterium]
MRTELKKEEKIIFVTRPHWYILILPVLYTLVGLVIAFFLSVYLWFLWFIVLIPGVYLTYKIIDRNNNLWAVTNLRVVDEEGVFSLSAKESPLDKINNVSYTQSFWGRIFRYGNVEIQTAAEAGETDTFTVMKPRQLKDSITQMQEEYKKYQTRRQAEEFADAMADERKEQSIDIAAEIEKLHELKQKGIITEEEFNKRKQKLLNS